MMKKHFLNNLILQLNSISRVAAMENAPESQKLVRQMINMIRYTTGREGQLLKVKEELAAAENLLEMFKVRYGDMFTYEISVEESCLEFYVPHYTLMTFIENSIHHAFENKEGKWQITISLKETEDSLRIQISDNGVGFNYVHSLEEKDQEKGYGSIPSTLSRLARHYGMKDIVQIRSSKSGGTAVTISIPKQGETI